MNGLLLYNKYDYEKNRRFAGLLCEKGKAFDLSLSLCFTDEAETLSRIFKAGDPPKALDPASIFSPIELILSAFLRGLIVSVVVT